MVFAKGMVVFSLGFFALAVQTLLFRDFLTVFEGNELGVGCFFASWLVWVALGALLGKRAVGHGDAPPQDGSPQSRTLLESRFELAVLLYIPAFVAQRAVIAHGRTLAGVEPYELFPLGKMAGLSFLANAPISFLTGLLFTAACRWAAIGGPADRARRVNLPVAKVFILETLGSCAAGIAVTLMLANGVPGERVFVVTALVLAVSSAHPRFASSRRGALLRLTPCLLLVILFALQLDQRWTEWSARARWSRLLPVESYSGRFTTPQAEYLYGERETQFVVMAYGGAVETVPDLERASETVALHLAQKPDARRVLVVGPGSLSICRRFLEVPQIERVVWLHPDPAYPKALAAALPERFAIEQKGLEIPGVEVRDYLRREGGRFDLAILNLPDATTLVLNRYSTREFLVSLKERLTKGGAVSLRVTGAENYMGGELAYLGASALITLESVFDEIVLKPGDGSWFLAADGDVLSESPTILRDRFADVPGADAVFPPAGLLSLYLPDRAAFQMKLYREIETRAGPSLLLNMDRAPKALLYSLLVAARESGATSVAAFAPTALRAGPWIMFSGLLLYGALRGVYLFGGKRSKGRDGSPLFDSYFLLFSMGFAGMALSIVLMFMYQARFGSLFLHIGLITALYMFGSFAGGAASERLLRRRAREPSWLLPACIGAHIIMFGAAAAPVDMPRTLLMPLFMLAGVFTGVYFPIGAFRLREAGRDARSSGSALETLDSLGGALGGGLTGVVLIPVLGTLSTLGVLTMLVAVNLTAPAVCRARCAAPDRRRLDWFDRAVRPTGYLFFGIGAFLLVASQIAATMQRPEGAQVLRSAGREMVSGLELEERDARLADGNTLRYLEALDGTDVAGYVFSTEQLAPDVTGYGGPMALAVFIEPDGTLRAVSILESSETPAYLVALGSWLRRIEGARLFDPGSFENVDAVSGATLTSEAIMEILRESGRRFAKEVLGIEMSQSEGPRRSRPAAGKEFVLFAAFLVSALALHYRPNKWLRRLFLAAVVAVFGLWLNLQYSTQHAFALLSLDLPGFRLNGPFALILIAPLFVLVFGNLYCGYLCPFGAIQELVGDLRPRWLDTDPEKRRWRYARFVKYALLLLIVIVFGLARRYEVLGADPLTTVFGSARDAAITAMAVAVVLLSFFFRRFWCRNLCPVGAFLALINGLRLLGKWLPTARPGRCDLGVRSLRDLDCIRCDRCRYAKK